MIYGLYKSQPFKNEGCGFPLKFGQVELWPKQRVLGPQEVDKEGKSGKIRIFRKI